MESSVKAVVFADGPECQAKIAGRTLLELWIERLAEAGVSEVRIVGCEPLEEDARPGFPRCVEAAVADEPGVSAAVAANVDLADGAKAVFVIHAKYFSDVDLGKMLTFHLSREDGLTVLLFHSPDSQSVASLDDDKTIISLNASPSRGDLADAGVYLASADVYREIAEAGKRHPSAEILPRFVGRMRGWPWVWYHVDVSGPEALKRVQEEAEAILADRQIVGRPAVFLDRDGTIIEEKNYLADPEDVRILPGVAEALRNLRAGGFARIVVTNQSAVGRGMITEERLHEIHEAMHHRLHEQGAAVDAVYYCPDAPALDDASEDKNSKRKPGAGMLRAAAADLGLDLSSSWMIGDQIGDLLAGNRAGCVGSILVGTGKGLSAEGASREVPHLAAKDLLAASEMILDGKKDMR